MAFDNSGRKAVSAAQLRTTPKRCEPQLFFARIRPVVGRGKALDLRRLDMQFQEDLPKDKNYSYLNFCLKTGKFCLTELYDAVLKGSTLFLHRSSRGRLSLQSYRLAELKYVIFSSTGRRTKKLRSSKLFLSTVFKHGLLEKSTILLQYSSTSHRPLESSRLGELK